MVGVLGLMEGRLGAVMQGDASSSVSVRNSEISRDKKMACIRGNFQEDILEWSVLPLLPVKSLLRFKCVCKTWYTLISTSQNFIMRQYEICTSLHSLNVGRGGYMWQTQPIPRDGSSLSFASLLPYVKGYKIVGACNGLVVMGCKLKQAGNTVIHHGCDLQFVVGNPVYQDWTGILLPVRPSCAFGIGLVYDPTSTGARYELVFYNLINRTKNYNDFTFYVFSSDIGKWKVSKSEIRVHNTQFFWRRTVASISGILYWVVSDFCVMWYDTKKDSSGLVPMPMSSERSLDRGTLNESNGVITYARVIVNFEMEVWTLKDFQWLRIHHLRIQVILQGMRYDADLKENIAPGDEERCIQLRGPRAFSIGFDGKEAFFVIDGTLFGYDLKNGKANQYPPLRFVPSRYLFYKASLIPTPGQEQQQLFPPIANHLKQDQEGEIYLECRPVPDVLDVEHSDRG